MTASEITTKDRAHLRSMAHELNPVVQIGTDGISEGVTDAVDVALTEHELIKVRVGQNYEGDRKQAGVDLAAATRSELTQVIGRVIVLYRPRPHDLPGKPRIALPSGRRRG